MSPKKPTLRDLSRKKPSAEDARIIFEEMASATDRTMVILSSAALENILTHYIIETLPRRSDDEAIDALIGRDGPLSTFFAVIHLAYAMKLISKMERDDMNIVRRIRNAFAHSAIPVDFTQPEIASECRKLNHWQIVLPHIEGERAQHRINEASLTDERVIFAATCIQMLTRFAIRHVRYLERYSEKLEKSNQKMRDEIKAFGSIANEELHDIVGNT